MKYHHQNIFYILSISFLFSFSLIAQQYAFKVLAYSGDVEYKIPSNNNWSKIKTGDNLQNDNQLKIKRDSYAALLYSDGRTLEMMKEGVFNVNELENTVLASKTTITQNFANFIVEKIIVDKNKGKNMKEFAAVVRVKPFHIELSYPVFTYVMESKIDFSWYSYPGAENYVLTILNSSNTPIYMDVIDDTSYTLDADKLKLNKGVQYSWFITDAENAKISSDTCRILFLRDSDRDLILDTLKTMKEEIKSNTTPLNYLALGLFFERNNLNLDALDQFNKVISLAPHSEEYKLLIARFLADNKLYTRISELEGDEELNDEN